MALSGNIAASDTANSNNSYFYPAKSLQLSLEGKNQAQLRALWEDEEKRLAALRVLQARIIAVSDYGAKKQLLAPFADDRPAPPTIYLNEDLEYNAVLFYADKRSPELMAEYLKRVHSFFPEVRERHVTEKGTNRALIAFEGIDYKEVNAVENFFYEMHKMMHEKKMLEAELQKLAESANEPQNNTTKKIMAPHIPGSKVTKSVRDTATVAQR